MDKHYSPAINNRLQVFVKQKNWQGLSVYLDSLSNSNFRTAGYMIGECFFMSLPEDEAWDMAKALVCYNTKAFLVTLLKGIAERLTSGTLKLHSMGAKSFWEQIRHNPVDVQKVLLQLLPVMKKTEDVLWLFNRLDIEEGLPRLPYLTRTATLPASFVLFCALKYMEGDRALLVRITYYLMKRGDSSSFNLASLLRAYYGLDEVKGTFSLHLEPYQLARIENSYDAFCDIMCR